MHDEAPEREPRRGEPAQSREQQEKEDPNSLENLNKRGIYVPSEQTFEEFVATQSAAYKTRYANLAALEAHTRGLEVGSDEYNAAMAAYRKQALALAVSVLMNDEKLPGALSQSMKWYKELEKKGKPLMFCEPMSYEVDPLANMVLRQLERLESMFNFGQMLEPAYLVGLAYQNSTAFSARLVVHPLCMGGHSTGKSYLLKAMGKTLSDGIWHPMTTHSAKSMATAGDSSCQVNFIDEASAAMVGASTFNANDEKESLFKAILTDPVVMSKVTFHNGETRTRGADLFVQIHHVVFALNYDGIQPKSNSALFQRFFPIYFDNIPTSDMDSITKRQNLAEDFAFLEFNADVLHIERLYSFFCAIANFLIFTKVVREPNMNAFRKYYDRFERNMQSHGYTIVNPKKLDMLCSIAHALTVRYAVYVAMLSDANKRLRFDAEHQRYRSVFDNLPTFANLLQAHLTSTRAISIMTLSLGRSLFGSSLGPRIADAMYQTRMSAVLEHFAPECFGANRARVGTSRIGDDDGDGDDEDAPEERSRHEVQEIVKDEDASKAVVAKMADMNLDDDFDQELYRAIEGTGPKKTPVPNEDSNGAFYGAQKFAFENNEAETADSRMKQMLLSTGFEQSFSEQNHPQTNPNYVELRTNGVYSVVAAATTLQNYFRGSRPSNDSLVAALHEMSNHRIGVQMLAIDQDSAKVVVAKKDGRPITATLPVVKIVPNTRKYGPNSTTGLRVFILTQYIVQRLSLVLATKDSLRGLAFNNSLPGRFLTSMPSYVSRFGISHDAAVRKCEPTIPCMIKIVPNDSVWIVANPRNTNYTNIESIAQSMCMPDSKLRRNMPGGSSLLSAEVIEMEPEITHALEHAAVCGVNQQYRRYVIPAEFELLIHAVRQKQLDETGRNVTFRYPQVAIANAQKRNAEHALAEMPQDQLLLAPGCLAMGNDVSFSGTHVDEALLEILEVAAPQAARALVLKDGKPRNFANRARVSSTLDRVLANRQAPPRSFVGDWSALSAAAKQKHEASKRKLDMLFDFDEDAGARDGHGDGHGDDDELKRFISRERATEPPRERVTVPAAAAVGERMAQVLYQKQQTDRKQLMVLLTEKDRNETMAETTSKRQRQLEEISANEPPPPPQQQQQQSASASDFLRKKQMKPHV